MRHGICTAWTVYGVGGCLEDAGVVAKTCKMFFRRGVESVRRNWRTYAL